MAESAFAQHLVDSIRKELELLKKHDYIQPQAYDQILNLLPKDVTSSSRSMPSYPASNAPASPFAGAMPSPVHNNPVPSPVQSNPLPPPPSYNSTANDNSLGAAEALYDYTGENPSTDLTIHRGDIIQLTEFVNNDWWKGTLNGKTGIFPSNYVKKIEKPINEKKASPPPTPSRGGGGYGYSPLPPKENSSYSNYPPPPSHSSSYAAPPPAQSYAPPPVQTYTPPPAQNNFAPPPIQGQVQSYAPPPVQHVASTSSAPAVVEEQHESKVSSFGKKFAGNVASAATWGFGATLGSDLANSIF